MGGLAVVVVYIAGFQGYFSFCEPAGKQYGCTLLTVIPVLATGIILTLFCDTYGLLPIEHAGF